MSLSQKHLEDVCMLYSGDSRTCRYLIDDDQGHGKWYCLKMRPEECKKINLRLREFLRDCKKKGIDPISQNIPLGDNCQGYLLLRDLEQGYDK
jgi:hypothetical protein